MADRESGTVKWFNDQKGFGQQVEFEVVQGQKGPAAENVVAK